MNSWFRTQISARKPEIFLFVSLFLFILSSCSQWRDFTTYFNVYYDAKRHMDAYEEKLGESQAAGQSGAIAAVTSHRWLDEEYETRKALNSRGATPPPIKLFSYQKETPARSGDVKHLDSVVILGSKILADKHQTEYVEDALFLCGKALYYKNDYSGAKRKFNELLFKYPKTNYAPEVGRLLTHTLIVGHQYDTAMVAIAASLDRAKATGTKEDRAEAHKIYAELLLTKGSDNIELAAEQLGEAEENTDGEEKARLAFERGSLYYIEGAWEKARGAFEKAISLTGEPFMQGEAHIAHALTLKRDKKFDEARAELEDVLQKTRFAGSHPAAQYELAVVIEEDARVRSGGKYRDARFTQKIYPPVKEAYYTLDTTYRNISQAIMVRSRFRQAELFRTMGEYDSAAHLANLIIGTKDFSSPEINDYVNDRMRALQRFAEWRNTLSRTEHLERLMERSRVNGTSVLTTMQREIRNQAEQQVLGARWSPDVAPHFTPDEEKQVKEAEVRIKKERETAGDPLATFSVTDTAHFTDSLFFVSSKAHFELGRAYETFDEPMSAITEYTLALDKQYNNFDTAKKSFNARVIFSWIELDNQLKRTSERDSLITILTTKYGESVYASMAGHLYSGETKKDSPGEKAYSDAYAVLRRGGLDAAKGQMLGVVTSYSHEDVAPRALYAIGIAYEDISRYDSALYYYKRVVNEYPYSSYADELKPRLLAAMGPAKTAPTTTTTTKSNAPPAQSQTVKPPVTPGTADDQNAQTNMTTEQSDDKHPILQSAPNMKVQRDSVIIPVPNAKKIKK